MAQKTNSSKKFWQELKRRKVFGVVTTYAATAYIIIEVTNNLITSLNLPNWIGQIVVILLVIGLPVVIILSWIFDFTPKGIIKTESLEELEGKEIVKKSVKRKLRASYVFNAILIIAVIVLAYPKIFKQDRFEKLRSSGERISVAVMPFQNMTNDTTWNVWQEGIQDILITSLSNSEELKVRQAGSITSLLQSKGLTNYASITPSAASIISQQLDANVFIYGSIKRAGPKVRLDAQLIDSKTEEIFKSYEIDGSAQEEMIFQLTDSLKRMVKNSLIISNLEKELPARLADRYYISTGSPEAFRNFIYGNSAHDNGDFTTAAKMFSQAIVIDSSFTAARLGLAYSYINQHLFEEAKDMCLRLYRKREQMPMELKTRVNAIYAYLFETPYEQIKCYRQLLEFDDQWPSTYANLGDCYHQLQQYEKAIPELKKALDIYDKWDIKPITAGWYNLLGYAYHKTGQYKKEKKIYKKAEKYFPNDPDLMNRLSVLSLTEGDKIAANKYIEKYKTIRKEDSWPDAAITTILATIYSEAGLLDKAEENFRKALSMEPEKEDWKYYNLAWFLIEKDRDINEGLELIDKALELNPDNFIYLHYKGWGLFKLGKYQEAMVLLQKSWDIIPIYNHDYYLHLESAKKAVANQKNN